MTTYLALVDKGEAHYGIVFPDCPGCVAMADSFETVVRDGGDALREWIAERVASGLAPPRPRTLGELRSDPSLVEDFAADPVVAAIPVPLDDVRSVRASISLDAGLLSSIDEAASARGLTRSAFLASAVREKLAGGK